jgi:tetratricopeptide (TPR) repeat protein
MRFVCCAILVGYLIGFQPWIYGQDSVEECLSRFASERKLPSGEEYQKFWQQGLASFQKEEYSPAAEAFAQAALISPEHPLPSLYLAVSLFAMGEYTYSAQVMRRSVALYPDWKNLPVNFVKLFPVHQQFLQKLARFESWLFQETRPLDAYLLFGILCQFSGESRKAEVAYRMVLNKEPFCWEACYFLEMVLGKEVATGIPSYAALKAQGEKAIEEKQYLKSIDIWLTACAEYPKESEALYSLGYSLAASACFEQAAAAMRLGIRKRPDILPLQIQAQSRWLQKESSWLASLEEYFQTQSKRSDILFLLGYLYAAIGEVKKAQIACKHLRQAEPNNLEIQELEKFLEKISPPEAPKREPSPTPEKKQKTSVKKEE